MDFKTASKLDGEEKIKEGLIWILEENSQIKAELDLLKININAIQNEINILKKRIRKRDETDKKGLD